MSVSNYTCICLSVSDPQLSRIYQAELQMEKSSGSSKTWMIEYGINACEVRWLRGVRKTLKRDRVIVHRYVPLHLDWNQARYEYEETDTDDDHSRTLLSVESVKMDEHSWSLGVLESWSLVQVGIGIGIGIDMNFVRFLRSM